MLEIKRWHLTWGGPKPARYDNYMHLAYTSSTCSYLLLVCTWVIAKYLYQVINQANEC